MKCSSNSEVRGRLLDRTDKRNILLYLNYVYAFTPHYQFPLPKYMFCK